MDRAPVHAELVCSEPTPRAGKNDGDRCPAWDPSILEQTIDRLEQGIAIYDASLRLVRWNRAFEELHAFPADLVRRGVTAEQLIRANAALGGYGDGDGDMEALIATRLDRMAGRSDDRFEDCRADGRILEVRRFVLPGGDLVSTYTDVTARRAAETAMRKNEQRFRDFAHSSSEWLWEMGPDLRFTYMSDQLISTAGFSLHRVIGLTRPEAAGISSPDDLTDMWRRHMEDLEAHRPFRDFRYQIRSDAGDEVHVSISGVPIFDESGAFRGYRGTGINVDAEVLAERKAQHAQARLRDAIESILDGFALFDADDTLVLCNENYRRALYRVGDLLKPGTPWEQLLRTLVARDGVIIPEGQDPEAWMLDRIAEHNRPRAKRVFQTADERWIEVREYPTAEGGRVLIRADITDQIRSKEALRESEERFRDFASSTSDWFWEMGPDLRFTWLSAQFQQKTGIPASRVIGRSREDFGNPADKDSSWQRHLITLRAHRPFRDFRYQARGNNGELFYFSTSGVPLFDASGRFSGYRGTSSDITARILAERRAAAAHARLLDAIANISEGFMLWDRNDRLVLCNNQVKDIYSASAPLMRPGVPFEDILRRCIVSGSFVLKGVDSESWIRWRLERHRSPGDPFEQELNDGRTIMVHERRTNDGGVAGIHIDITPLKAREAALRSSQESLANAQRIAHIGNWDLKVGTNELLWSDEVFRIFGHAPQAFEPTYDDFLDAVHPEDREAVETAVKAALYGEVSYAMEHRVVRPDATERWVHQHGEVTFANDGVVPVRMTGTVQDITERKLAELACETAERRFRLAFETFPDAVSISRFKDGAYVDVNRGFEEITGYRHEDAVGKRAVDVGFWIAPEHREHVMRQVRLAGALRNEEITFRRADGTPRTALVSVNTFELDGETHLLAVTKDVTELKDAEHELRKLSRAVEESAASVIITNRDGVIEYVNRRFTEITGYLPEEAIGATPRLLKSGELSQAEYRDLWSTISSGRSWRGEFRNQRKDDSLYWASALISPVRKPDGEITHYVGIQEDITEHKIAEERLRDSEERFRGLVEGSVLGIVIDIGGVPLFANERFARMFGYRSPEDILALKSMDFLYHDDDIERIRHYRRARTAGEPVPLEYEFRGRHRDGSVIWLRTHVRQMPWQGQTAVQSTLVDITKQKEYEEQLHRQANYDPLTDLPNRTLAMDRLETAVANARRHRSGLGVLFIDVDHFKTINDTLGHASGDRFLREVARRIQACLRQQDTVARLGGDEFTVILADLEDGKDAEAVARKIQETFARRFELDSQEAFSSASIGIALFPEDGEEPETLMRNADAAMYQAKEQGRNAVHFFTHELNARARERVRLEVHLRRGIVAEEFRLNYQPMVDIRTGRFVRAEALLRWDNPSLGSVTPDRFIRLAENSGLIVPLGQWVLETACRQIAQWRREGLGHLSLSVNISSRQFRGALLVDAVAEALEHSGIPPTCLELEITEGTLMDDLPQTQIMIADLKRLGVRLAVDDFGTGYSSLSYLSRFPLDTLKIDKTFVRAAPSDPVNAALVDAMIAMAHALGMHTVAEGVERPEHLAFLRERGCDIAQGYLFSPALNARELVQRLNNWNEIATRSRQGLASDPLVP